MKKLLSIALVAAMLFACVAAAVPVSAATSGDYEYSVNSSDKTATITDYNGTEKNVVIPSVIKGYTITSIGEGAFENCTFLSNITIPEGVTSIRYNAFNNCSSLASVTIPESVTSIGDWTFYGCASLESVSIPESVTSIGDYAFEDCTSLANVTLSDSVTSIGTSAFSGTAYESNDANWDNDVLFIDNHLIKAKDYISGSYIVPEGTKTIAGEAFYNCTSLTSITIPEGVTSIGRDAFHNCTSLASVKIPSSVTSIGDYAFEDCTSLANVTLSDSVTSIGTSAFSGTAYESNDANWENDVLFIDNHLIKAKSNISGSYNVPEGTKTIADRAFNNCTRLASVSIPEGVTSIGSSAFSDCTSLKGVYITDLATWCNISFSSLHSNPLYYAKKLYINEKLATDIVIPEGVTSIGENAFYDCTSLKSVTIPASVTSIGNDAFYNCNSMTNIDVDINNDYYSSEDGVLFNKGKTNLIQYPIGNTRKTYFIPEGVTIIGDSAFKDCTSLASVTIPEGVTSIGNWAFYNCSSLANIIIPEGVTSIGYSAFYDCSSLTSITIPASVTSIVGGAFSNCTSLTSVTIHEGVTSIEWATFSGCTRLASVTIPESVTRIDLYAFDNCTRLASVTIPDSVTSIGYGAFSGTAYVSNEANWENDVLFIGNHLIKAKSYISGSYTVPEGTKTIAGDAFYKSTNLKGITIPEGVTSIGERAFGDCTSLASVTIPASVTSIGDYAFSDCTSLESITIPEGVTSIGEDAFYSCTSLESVTIPEGVASIGERAFYNCTSLESITIPASVTSIDNYAFSECGLKHVLYAGTEEEWNSIVLGSSNDSLKNAVSHYSCSSEVISSVVVPPTCIDKGYTKCRCSVCGYEYNSDYTQALGHSYEVITVVEPTCVNQGYTKYRCSVCGVGYTNSTDSLGHNFVDGSCSKCGVLEEDLIESEHNYANNCDETWTICKPKAKWMAITFNTSTKTGSGDFIYIYNAYDNLIGEYSGTDLAGKRIIVKSDTVKIRLISDSWGVCYGFALSNVQVYYEDCRHTNTEIRNAKKPTCVTAGSKGSVYCIDCDKIIAKATVIPATGLHEMTETVIEPSCTAAGYTQHCCSVCGYSYTSDSVPALGHSGVFVETVSPDCINQGYDIYRCSVCGEEYYINYTSSFGGHTFENGVCISCGVLEEDLIESEHNYANNSDLSWEINKPHAKSITITFSADTYTESYYDYIYIYDANDTLIGKYTGSQLASQSVTVEGNTVTIRLTSDGFGTGYGFRLTNVAVVYPPIIEGVIIYGEIEEGAQLYVDRVDISDLNISNVYIYDIDSALVYDIYIEKDGNRIQPKGQTVISIPVPDTMNEEKCKVIFIDDSGKITDMNAVFENGFMTFTTDHFSYFALVEKTDVLHGDLNGDGVVTLKDILISRKYVAGVSALTEEEISRGDLNGDGVLTLKDVLIMRKMVAGVL